MSENAIRLVSAVGRPGKADLFSARPWRRAAALAWLAADFAVALVLACVLRYDVVATAHSARPGMSVEFAQGLAALMCIGVALRRLVPIPAVAWTVAASAAMIYFGYGKDPMTALALVLFTAAVQSRRLVALAALAGAELGILVAASLPGHMDAPAGRILSTALTLAAAWTIGFALRARRAFVAGLREQAERRVQAEVDRSKRALAEERLRIARELHDIVSHSMSLIAVQAGVGAHVLESRAAGGSDDTEQGTATLRTIEATSRAALRELRSMLGVLREGEGESEPDGGGEGGRGRSGEGVGRSSSSAALVPAPDLSGLPELVARTRDAGLAIDVTVSGAADPLPGGVELAAYRIVQEALTNVVRHAKAERTHVELDYRDESLCLTVTDDGVGAAARPSAAGAGKGVSAAGGHCADHSGGHGLIGMRERVAMYGGEFSAGPGPRGGYRVRALFPVPGAGR